MSTDHTEHQSQDQIKSARTLSLKPKTPPAEVAGYKIESLLGSGAYGEVWLALDEKTGRRVAIKFYSRQTSLDLSLLSREVEKLVFLSADRYVVQLLDVGWDAKPPYYVMDYIENGSLEDELNRRESLPADEAVDLTEEICIGLMHLHGKGILHCDLKPGNVLLDQDKKPRLADFGQARLSHEQAAALGTLFFMAPEQADLRAAPDARWDVYALGALLYCMLTGQPPFRGEVRLEKIESSEAMEDRLARYRQVIEKAPVPTAHRKVPGVDRDLAEIIDRCIERNPKKRFGSVQSVFQALRDREHAQARRPLIILGLLGPLLLLAVMSLFGWNAYRGAITQTDNSITNQTLDSSQWIAQLAARSAAEQIDNYFRVLNELTNDPRIQEQMALLVNDPTARQLLDQLEDPHQNNNELLSEVRNRFIDNQLRERLQTPLQKNLDDPTYPKAASWFLCDYTGTQIASVFNTSERDVKVTIGQNFSWRTYFTGDAREAINRGGGQNTYLVEKNASLRPHIEGPTMSAIFISQATKNFKIAFSEPIYYEGQFLGIASVTADMGSFIEFDNAQEQYVMLVDGRQGDYHGTVIEHPLLAKIFSERGEIPDSLNAKRIGNDVLRKLNSADENDTDQIHHLGRFQDPLASDLEGVEFDKEWLAAWARVKSRVGTEKDSDDRVDTGFRVIAVADHGRALQPSRQLGQQMARIGSLAVLFFLLVSAGLLYIVFRSLKKSRDKVARMLGMTADGTLTGAVDIQDKETLISSKQD